MAPATQVKVNQAVLLFDGVCNLCNGFVNFIIDRDVKKKIKFGSLQSEKGGELLSQNNLDPQYLDSLVFLNKNKVYTKSRAALEVVRVLGIPWVVLYPFVILPGFFRDWIYDVIAKNRYKWFGQREACRIPTPELMDRFLDS